MGLTGKILITGGTGTLGKAILERAYQESWDADFTVLSRGEIAQRRLKARYPGIKFVIGDIRNYDLLAGLCIGHDLVIHAAAYKFIDTGEHNAAEVYSINVEGSVNVCLAAQRAGVQQVIGISTDKACKPVNVYGASKLLMEKVFQNFAKIFPDTRYTLTRYGNVIDSTGSVVKIWRESFEDTGMINLTSPEMSRFWLSPKQAIDIILATTRVQSGQILIRKLPGMNLLDMANALYPNADLHYSGLRPGEKLHELLLCSEESRWDTSVPGDLDFILDPMYRPVGTNIHRDWASNEVGQLTADELKEMLNE